MPDSGRVVTIPRPARAQIQQPLHGTGRPTGHEPADHILDPLKTRGVLDLGQAVPCALANPVDHGPNEEGVSSGSARKGWVKPSPSPYTAKIATAISRRWVREATAFQTDDEGESIEAQIDSMDDNAADEQATPSPHIAGLIYARDVIELVGSSVGPSPAFPQSQRGLAWVFGVPGAPPSRIEDGIGKRKRCDFEEDAGEEYLQRRV
ncbi:hypothetical protein LTR49_023814 [Elasticomyces elasticus]|nr:hypothetical protein LTR49_023814 [Elasticomyces elasticus]